MQRETSTYLLVFLVRHEAEQVRTEGNCWWNSHCFRPLVGRNGECVQRDSIWGQLCTKYYKFEQMIYNSVSDGL